MNFKIETIDNVVVARVGLATLDLHTTQTFRRQTQVLVSDRYVVLDLTAVEFIDSTGLGALLSLLRKLTLNGGDLRLSGVGSQVLSIFRLVRMNKVFEIYPNIDEAVSSFSHPVNHSSQPASLSEDTGQAKKGRPGSSEMIRQV